MNNLIFYKIGSSNHFLEGASGLTAPSITAALYVYKRLLRLHVYRSQESLPVSLSRGNCGEIPPHIVEVSPPGMVEVFPP